MCADFCPINLERIAVACNSSFPLPARSVLLPARPTHALRTCYVCLLFDFYPLNLERIAVACSSGFPLPASFEFLPGRPTHALRCSRTFKARNPGAHRCMAKQSENAEAPNTNIMDMVSLCGILKTLISMPNRRGSDGSPCRAQESCPGSDASKLTRSALLPALPSIL